MKIGPVSIGLPGLFLFALLLASLGLPPALAAQEPQGTAASVLYVKPEAAGSGDCSSWDDACTLQTALSRATNGAEIWVAAGVHKPTTNPADREAFFRIRSGVAVYGGFAGTESAREERDWLENVTVLSGDIDNNDITDANGVITSTTSITGTNSYHLVFTGQASESPEQDPPADYSAVLDGFTITGGLQGGMFNIRCRYWGLAPLHTCVDACSPSLRNLTIRGNSGGGMSNDLCDPYLSNVVFDSNTAADGGGMRNISSSPHLYSVAFRNNTASEWGGGMFNLWPKWAYMSASSSPDLHNVTFHNNSAGEFGGGMYNSVDCNPILEETTFTENSAAKGGGGMFNLQNQPTLTNVSFQNNRAETGGGMSNEMDGNPTLSDVAFTQNRADLAGGGLHNFQSSPDLTHVTFQDNWARLGGGMYSDGGSPRLTNVTIRNNGAYDGGGMHNFRSEPDLVNVVFDGNTANSAGGGMLNRSESHATLVNVTLGGNSAGLGGGMHNWKSSPTIANSILWGNSSRYGGSQIDNLDASTPVVSFSVVQGSGGSGAWDATLGTDGGGNLDVDPLFANAADGDLRLSHDSPAVDAGDNGVVPAGVVTDVAGKARFVDIPTKPDTGTGTPPIVDMGALEATLYEFLPQLSKKVDKVAPRRNERLVYTIVVENVKGEAPLWGGVISDPLPSGLAFAGPIAITPPGAGTAGTAPPILVSNLSLDTGQRVTVTLPVTVSAFVPGLRITNTASIAVAAMPGEAEDSVAIDIHPIIYVDADATGANDGTSWEDAFTGLQAALDIAIPGNEVWVAEGVYTPTAGTDRTAAFQLKSGVGIYGGFASTETVRHERNWRESVTVLSGDIDGNDLTDANRVVTSTTHIVGANAYHVVAGNGVDESAVLDGFTITAGQANGSSPHDQGGGLLATGGSPTLANLVFQGNLASDGGGMANLSSSRPALTNVVLRDNAAGRGGGIFNHSQSAPGLVNVALFGNTAADGAAMLNELYARPSLVNVTLQGNMATGQGGGIVNRQTTTLTVTNSILWGNGDEASGDQIYNDGSSAAVISYSDVQGGWPGTGNIEADPLFADAAEGDLRLQLVSPAIDAGANQALPADDLDLDHDGDMVEPIPVDLAGIPRFLDIPTMPDSGTGAPPIVDMGAFEALYYGAIPRVEKTVDVATPWAGDRITFAIAIENPDETLPLTNGGIWDTLPPGLTFAGPVELEPPGAGSVGAAPPLLASDLTVGPGQRVTVTLPVTVDADLSFDDVVTNTAAFSSTETPIPINSSMAISIAGQIYVDGRAIGLDDGTSWANAYADLQDALEIAEDGDQIWVAMGIYRPTSNGTDRSAAFQIGSGVAMYGGFAGTPGTEGDLSVRDWERYVTTLSGDIDQNDLTDPQGVVASSADIAGANSYHVVTYSGASEATVLDGFCITGGVADGTEPHDRGGGMASTDSSPRLANLAFSGNRAVYGGGMSTAGGKPVLENVRFEGNQATMGGGMINEPGSEPALLNVTFSHNRADQGGGGMLNRSSSPTLVGVAFSANSAGKSGGGLYNDKDSNSTLRDVVFEGNSAINGGGIYNWNSSPALTDVAFQGNWANYGGGLNNHWQSHPTLVNATFTGNSASLGGGMDNFVSSPVLENVVFYGNTAWSQGGGICSGADSHPSLTNVTLSGNSAPRGGGLYSFITSTVTIDNSILWDNTATAGGAQIDHDDSSTPAIRYSDIQDGWPGTGNIDADPLFVKATSGDLRLWHTSPAIDAGDNAAVPEDSHDLDGDGDTSEPIPIDLAGKPRFSDIPTLPDTGQGAPPIVDMGAFEAREYEFVPKVTKTVDHPAPRLNERITYTITVENIDPEKPLTSGVISDTLPAGLVFAGPVSLEPPDAGTAGTEPPILVSNLTLDPEERITVTFPVTVAAYVPGGIALNTAAFTSAETSEPAMGSVAIHVHPIIYVDEHATGANDGTSWENAFPGLQEALALALAGNEIWVAEGVYRPTIGTDRSATFQLKNDVAVYGGFAGTEDARQQRDCLEHVTVLSGDIDGNDGADANGVITDTANIASANAFHVVTGSGVDASALLDGFTITGGQANGSSPDHQGGGMLIAGGSPTLNGLVLRGNTASDGGGMANLSHSRPLLTNLIFADNSADRGGGLANLSGTGATLVNVTFSGNSASSYGGGIRNDQSRLALHNAILGDNTAPTGSQIHNELSISLVSNSDILGSGGSGSGWDPSLGTDGGGNLDVDPLFLDAAGGDMRLHNYSPAIDAGDHKALPYDTHDLDDDGNEREPLPFDMAGNPRILHDLVDMGAFETAFLLEKAVDDTTPVAGQRITYTVTVENASTATQLAGGLISDTLPPGLSLAGPVTVDPPGSGTVASVHPILIDDVTLDPGQRMTVTLAVAIQADLPGTAAMTNTVEFTSARLPALLMSSAPVYLGGVIYVDGSASGEENGTSWQNAYTDLQDALATATPGDEIWVAAGVYKPADEPNRAAAFQLRSGVAVLGGFAGTETAQQQRHWQEHVTVLSGDIDGNDWTDALGVITDTNRIQGNNSYHVVTASGVGAGAVLDGFTITGGQANGAGSDLQGGGMHNDQSSPILRNLIFRGNTAAFNGGGIYNDRSSPELANVAFLGNSAAQGGGIYNRQSHPVLTNVSFNGNIARNAVGSGILNLASSPAIANSILWGNGTQYAWAQIYNFPDSNPVIRTSDIQGSGGSGAGWYSTLGIDGGGNLDLDPLFADALGGDLRLLPGSPVINAGDDEALPKDTHDLDGDEATGEPIPFDLAMNPRIVDGTVDMGAFEHVPLLVKTVNDRTPAAGDPITYTIVLENPYATTQWTDGIVSDTLPPGLTFVGPITLDPPHVGSPGTAPPVLVSDLNLAPGERATVTLPVMVNSDLPATAVITNTAALTIPGLPAPGRGSVAINVAGYTYVDDSATGANNGSSWTHAFRDLQDALAAVDAGDEIWVAEGIYRPTDEALYRFGTFYLKDGVALYGGFAGTPGTEGDFEVRDWETYITVLSGDIDQNDTTDAHGVVTNTAHIIGTNSYHVVIGSFTDASAVLDGFAITGGYADGPSLLYDDRGGGMHVNAGSPTVSNTVFRGNKATEDGGGMYNNLHSDPRLTNVLFRDNTAVDEGGGMYNDLFADPMLEGVTFIGNAAGSDGGGMFNDWFSQPLLTEVEFRENSAARNGGGLYNDVYNDTTLTDVIFIRNTAGNDGGAFFNKELSNPTLTNVSFISNTAFYDGGGMYNLTESDPVLVDVEFRGNVAGDEGGGLFNKMFSDPVLTSVTFISNTATEDDGGGIYNIQSSPVLSDVVFQENVAGDAGGGMYNDTFSDPELTNVTFISNTAASDGGGICNNWFSQPSLTGVAFRENTAGRDGGGMSSQASSGPYLSDTEFRGNWAGNHGGGLCVDGGSPELIEVTFLSNMAASSGGGMYSGSSTPELTSVTFISNTASSGGGMHSNESSVTLDSTIFVGNVAQGSGGGMYNLQSNATLTGVTFRDNRAVGGEGGGMVNYTLVQTSSQTISNTLFSGNSAGLRGGGMANTESSPTLTGVTFDDNYAGDNGGGMFNMYFSNPRLRDVTFSNNMAENHGGGMLNASSSPTLTHVTFSGNSTGSNIGGGAGMYNDGSNPTLIAVLFQGNSAHAGDGGGMFNWESNPALTNVLFAGNLAHEGGGMRNHDASNPVLTNVTFAGNVASWDGGGILNYGSDPIVQNSILWGNSAEHQGSQMFNFFIDDNPVIRDTIVQDGCPQSAYCSQVIGADPLFIRNPDPGDGLWTTLPDNDYGDLHLRLGSPAIDAGDNTALPPGVTTDLDGNPRIANGRVDMGAYEAGLVLVKSVDDPAPRPGDPVLFTIVAENTYTNTQISGGVISDTLPAGLTFVRPISLDPPGGGTVGPAPPVLVSDLTIAPSQRVTVTLPAMVDEDAPTGMLYNTASLTSIEVPGPLQSRIALYVSSGIIHVDDSATGMGNGGSWENAFTDLEDALAIASGERQIWVAEGIYVPTQQTDPFDRRTATFQLRSGVEIYGGFPNGGGSFADRDWIAHPAVLSGDLDGNDITNPKGILTTTAGIVGENAYNVVTGSGTDASARLDGFTITGGKTGEPWIVPYRGGGMFNKEGSPTLVNLRFLANSAYQCGGMVNDDGSPTLINVAFHGNSAIWRGGGLCNVGFSRLTLINATFSGNMAAEGGGGMTSFWSAEAPVLVNVTFYGNSAGDRGGGMYNYGSPMITNTILWGNTATNEGDQMYNDRTYPRDDTSVAFSLMQDGCPPYTACSELLTADPLFVNAAGPDGIPGTPDDDLRLQSTSPAIDAGDNAALPADSYDLDGDGDRDEPLPLDLDGNPRTVNGKVDMGALESVTGVALVLGKTVDEPTPSAGDRITYTVVAWNGSSDTAATGGKISDPLPSGLTFAGPITLDPPGAGIAGTAPPVLASELSIDPGGRVTVTLPVTVDAGLPGSMVIANTATMSCAQVSGAVTGEVAITVAAEPEIKVVKTASVSQAQVGETITYTYWVTNTGNVTLNAVNAVDDPLGSVSLGTTSLALGQGTSGTLSYTVRDEDLPGPLTNTVTASGQPPSGPALTAEAIATVNLVGIRFEIYLPLVMR